jgi:3-hydroxyacyl-CoA dehydrogenase/enoyl-CoA hydratase/3-hydroxybutyryl-CoA epimerase
MPATPLRNGHSEAGDGTPRFAVDSVGEPSSVPGPIRRAIRNDDICVLTFDRPGSSANIFDRATLVDLREHLLAIASQSRLNGLILTSAKPSIFIAGADLKSMSEASSDGIRELIELGQSVMNCLADLSIPTVAAIHGAAVGGGYEVSLACDYRIASTDRATKIGLPEIQLGLLPGWGGCTRLPRLIGLPKALDIILAGKTVAAKRALNYGMVDAIVPPEYLIEQASKILRRGKRAQRSFRLANNAPVASILRKRLTSRLLRKTRGHYPAVLKALDVVTHGISKTVSESLALEREGIVELTKTDTCRNLIQLFFLQERAKKLSAGSAGVPPADSKITRTAVIGAGVMGAGIAQWLTAKNLKVILRDINTEQVARGLAAISKLYHDGAKRRIFTPLEARQGMDRVFPAPEPVPLKPVELVIEAAVERLDLKKKIFLDLDTRTDKQTILATNTSALPISELAAATRHPERVVGLHFFNPVHRMRLVEVVAARQTSPEVLQRAVKFVQQIGKLPVLVKDSPGFVVNRILMPYLIEAGNLFEAGVPIRDLDEAMLDFGMPMGPMRLLDEVGIDVALHVAETVVAHFPDRTVIPEILQHMVKSRQLGRKAGRGFYIHHRGKEPRPNRSLAIAHPASRIPSTPTDSKTLQDRMVLLMVNEAARCVEEGVVSGPEDVDFAMVMGTGFAPFHGGPLRYVQTIGTKPAVERMETLVRAGATHFEPCQLLRNLAASGRGFYEKPGTAPAAAEKN